MEHFLFSTIFCYLLLDFHVKIGPDFHFEISGYMLSEVEITRVYCRISIFPLSFSLHYFVFMYFCIESSIGTKDEVGWL